MVNIVYHQLGADVLLHKTAADPDVLLHTTAADPDILLHTTAAGQNVLLHTTAAKMWPLHGMCHRGVRSWCEVSRPPEQKNKRF